MLHAEVFVGEGLGAVDAGRAGAVAVEEVAALAHEVGDLEQCQAWGSLKHGCGRWLTMRWNLEPL